MSVNGGGLRDEALVRGSVFYQVVKIYLLTVLMGFYMMRFGVNILMVGIFDGNASN